MTFVEGRCENSLFFCKGLDDWAMPLPKTVSPQEAFGGESPRMCLERPPKRFLSLTHTLRGLEALRAFNLRLRSRLRLRLAVLLVAALATNQGSQEKDCLKQDTVKSKTANLHPTASVYPSTATCPYS